MAQPRVLHLTIAIVSFPGDSYRAACKVGGQTFFRTRREPKFASLI